MVRISRTYKETVRPSFVEAEKLDPSEERTVPEPRGETVKASNQAGTPQAQSEEETKVLYNDDLGNEIPRDEGVPMPATPPDLSSID